MTERAECVAALRAAVQLCETSCASAAGDAITVLFACARAANGDGDLFATCLWAITEAQFNALRPSTVRDSLFVAAERFGIESWSQGPAKAWPSSHEETPRLEAPPRRDCYCGQIAVWEEASFTGRARPPRAFCNAHALEYASTDMACTMRSIVPAEHHPGPGVVCSCPICVPDKPYRGG